LKSALLSSVSHDLRSPLTAINTAAASLLTYGEHFDPKHRMAC
jgi:two-component system sensor histidine kinase KdpD